MSGLILMSLMAVMLAALFAIRAELVGPREIVYIAKPLTTSLIIATALLLPDLQPYPYKILIVVGLLYSLAGDIFLMLPGDRFLYGLASFLVAHLCYIAAFAGTPDAGAGLWILIAYLLAGGLILLLLWPGIGAVRLPVVIYLVIILVMGWQAGARAVTLSTASGLIAAVGALFFIASDSALAWDRFRAPLRYAPLIVLGTYFAAQWLIALSVGVP